MSPGRTSSGSRSANEFCCQTRYAVLPGRHSQRSTALLRSDRTLKSRGAIVNDPPSAVTVREPSSFTTIVVPSSPYVSSSPERGARSSPNEWNRPLDANGSTYVSRLRFGVNV